MTGLELIKAEMKKAGANKSQIESNTLTMILKILGEQSGLLTEATEKEISMAKTVLNSRESLLNEAHNLTEKASAMKEEAEQYLKETEDKCKLKYEELSYKENELNELKIKILKCETAKQRDAVRMAEYFKSNIEINTVYDNTAYINGLASILSGNDEDENVSEDAYNSESNMTFNKPKNNAKEGKLYKRTEWHTDKKYKYICHDDALKTI